MKLVAALAAACWYFSAATPVLAEPAANSAVPVSVEQPVTTVIPAPAPVRAAAPAALPPPSAAASAGSLLQTILALSFVLALLAGLAWCMKRYGPKVGGANAAIRLVGSLSLGGRERIIVIEVADQWIVVGAAPGRVNALATMARQESAAPAMPTAQDAGTGSNFAAWLKQTIEKRNGK